MAKETYPTPFDAPEPGSRTTNADRTGARSENSVLRSVDVAVYGRFETSNVDLRHADRLVSVEFRPAVARTHALYRISHRFLSPCACRVMWSLWDLGTKELE